MGRLKWALEKAKVILMIKKLDKRMIIGINRLENNLFEVSPFIQTSPYFNIYNVILPQKSFFIYILYFLYILIYNKKEPYFTKK